MNRIKPILKIILNFLAGVAVSILVVAAASFLFMLLWNDIMPEVFDLPELTLYQSFGIMVLARMLFDTIHLDNKK